MPWLSVRNLTPDLIVFDGVIGAVLPDRLRTVFLRVSDVENVESALNVLQKQRRIEYTLFRTNEDTDTTQFSTIAEAKQFAAEAAGAGGSLAGIFILRPGASVTFPDSLVFADWNTLYARLEISGGGIVFIDDSLSPGSPIILPQGVYDLRGVYIQGVGNSQPTVVLSDGFYIFGKVCRFQNIKLLCYNSSPIIIVDGAEKGLVHFIDSSLTMMSSGHFLQKVQNSSGSADLVLENSVIYSPNQSGFAVYVDSGELVSFSVTKCSRILPNSLAGFGDIDVIRDSGSVVSKAQASLTGLISSVLCTEAVRRYGTALSGPKDGQNRFFTTPDSFTHDSLSGDTIVVYHNGRRLMQKSLILGGDYFPLESNGPGTGYNAIYFLAFTPNSYSAIEADYSVA